MMIHMLKHPCAERTLHLHCNSPLGSAEIRSSTGQEQKMNTKHSHRFQFLELVSTTYVKFSMQGVCVEYGPFVSRRIPFEYLINKADVASCICCKLPSVSDVLFCALSP